MTVLATVGAGPVRVSALATNDNGILPQPSIEFVTDDATYGTYISRIAYNGIAFRFAPASMFGVGLYNSSTSELVETLTSSWSPTITTAPATGVITILLELESPYDGISFTITLTPLIEGYQVTSIVVANTNATYAVDWFEFPRLGMQAPSGDPTNAYLAHGFCGGLTMHEPHNFQLNTVGVAIEAPGAMQFWDYYDASTKEHLYCAFDDEAGYTKRMNLTGDNDSVALTGFRHFVPNPRRAGNAGVVPYTFDYHMDIELFRGRTSDGRCGFYDAAIRYRRWATESGRPWMTAIGSLAWPSQTAVSSRVKNSIFYYVRQIGSPPTNPLEWTATVEDIRRIKDYIGASEVCGILYGWAEGLDFDANNFIPPKFYPEAQSADLETALATAATEDIHLQYYIATPFLWEKDGLTGAGGVPFQYDDFLGTSDYNSISQYVIRDKDNVVITNFTPPHPIGPFVPPLGDED